MNIGGYDVFRSSIVDGNYLEALNLGISLNSRRDDLAFVLVTPEKGYLSTDKSHSGNFDILKFEVKQLEKSSPTYTIVEQLSQLPLPNAKIVIKNEFGDIVNETVSDENGKIKIPLNPISYNYITVEKEGYEPFTSRFTSENLISDPIQLKQKKAEITADAIVIENILFAFDKDLIKAESELSLNKIVEVLNQFPEMTLTINAHTDNKGSDKYNLALSQRRAKSTVTYLISKGISKERLTYKGYGESKPLNDCTNCTPEQDQANRRVEFKINKSKN
jgi:outer membrane protein OmpA-like peptidoglycan-associated protein